MRTYSKLYKFCQFILAVCLVYTLSSCRETFDAFFSDDIEEGEEVMFTTSLPSASMTRATAEETAYRKQMQAYKAVTEAYEFSIGMYDSEGIVGTPSIYKPKKVTDEIVGTLAIKAGETPLYWPNTTTAYGFSVTAGDEALQKDQSTAEKWLKQDLLKGFGYVEKWDTTKNKAVDNLDALNYHTAKEWKKLNVDSKLLSNEKDYKKIPLYLQHQRALITVKLKAGEGVSSKSLQPCNAAKEVITKIYSHTSTEDTTAIIPLTRWESEVKGDTTMCYDAIVDPFNYYTGKDDNLIAKINLSGQNYSFYAGSDTNCSLENYDLSAGKHLIVTITLGRSSRNVLMSAYIEDWTENVTTTICDDYGHAGSPIEIVDSIALKEFLTGSENKAGNVGLVMNDIVLKNWDDSYQLHCTLNLGGSTIKCDKRFLEAMDKNAYLQNGTIQIGTSTDYIEVNAAIANTNQGTIDDVKITTINGAHATAAGAVVENSGSIIKCHSSIEISGGTESYAGGIAAKSITNSSLGKDAVITGCTVTNRVDGGTTACGGIVGLANGDITNNTFEYGITLSQNPICSKNIVGEIVGEHDFSNNSWPTTDKNPNVTNAATENLYTGIIDRESEFDLATSGNRYRLAKDITVSSTRGDVAYELDGNGKTISTKAMIFKNISGQVHDLTINVTADLIAEHLDKDKDIIAPLAEMVDGPTAEIRNIVVNAKGRTIQASNPAGVVVWAVGGAKVVNCEATANIVAKVDSLKGERKYAGGIVSTASIATISQCVFHKDSELRPATDITGAESIYYGGIVGGIGSWKDEIPVLTIIDCASLCDSYITPTEDAYHGGILGYAQKEVGTTYSNATSGCQGNWWPNNGDKISNGVASKGLAENYSVEKTIGKRNAVKPNR